MTGANKAHLEALTSFMECLSIGENVEEALKTDATHVLAILKADAMPIQKVEDSCKVVGDKNRLLDQSVKSTCSLLQLLNFCGLCHVTHMDQYLNSEL